MRREVTAAEIATVIAERLEEHAEQLRSSRELMDAKEAAEFLRLPYSEFKRIAPSLPRHPLTARRYVYYRSELLGWALSRIEEI